jgi:hypothetical protein
MKAISELAKDALDLPPSQQLILARILLDLSEQTQDSTPQVENAWEQEICSRIEAVKAGNAQSRDFTEVFADLDRRFRM